MNDSDWGAEAAKLEVVSAWHSLGHKTQEMADYHSPNEKDKIVGSLKRDRDSFSNDDKEDEELLSPLPRPRKEPRLANQDEEHDKMEEERVGGFSPMKEPSIEDGHFEGLNFPKKLMVLLSRQDLASCLRWLADGKAFAIEPHEFTKKVLPKYFQGFTKLVKFKNRLYQWGFKRLFDSDEPGMLTYYHKLFQKDEPELVNSMAVAKKPSYYKMPKIDPVHVLSQNPMSQLEQAKAIVALYGGPIIPQDIIRRQQALVVLAGMTTPSENLSPSLSAAETERPPISLGGMTVGPATMGGQETAELQDVLNAAALAAARGTLQVGLQHSALEQIAQQGCQEADNAVEMMLQQEAFKEERLHQMLTLLGKLSPHSDSSLQELNELVAADLRYTTLLPQPPMYSLPNEQMLTLLSRLSSHSESSLQVRNELVAADLLPQVTQTPQPSMLSSPGSPSIMEEFTEFLRIKKQKEDFENQVQQELVRREADRRIHQGSFFM